LPFETDDNADARLGRIECVEPFAADQQVGTLAIGLLDDVVTSAAAVGLIAVTLAFGCSLPNQQLALPGPITGSVADTGTTTSRKGTDLSDRADDAARRPRIFLGSGQFAVRPPNGTQGANGEPQATVSGDGVALSFSGATIAELSKVVLGETLKLNYAVSDSLKGSISIQTTTPVARKDLISVFETLIRQEGAALVVEGDLYRVVPAEGARATTFRSRNPAAGLRNIVVPLRFVSAEEMQRILTAVAPQSSVIRADESRSILIVGGTQAELDSVRETVGVFDVDWMRGMSFAILPVESADPEAIAAELDTVFANDRSSPSKGKVKFVPNRRLKAVLVMSTQPQYIAAAQKWVKRLDLVGAEAEDQVHVYRVQHRPVGELAVLLRRIYAAQSEQGGAGRGGALPGRASATITTGESSAGQPVGEAQGIAPADSNEPRIIPPFTPFPVVTPGANARAAQPTLGGDPTAAAVQPRPTTGSPGFSDDRRSGVQVVADDTNNSLVITARPREFQRIKRVLAELDVPSTQVLLEATIAEVTLNDQLRFGLRWFFQNGKSSATLTDLASGVVQPRFPGFSYFLNLSNIQVALNALSDVTKVNIVSSPSMMTTDNKRAVLQIGDEVPVATQSAVSITAPGAPIVNSISFRSTGVILAITPRVSETGHVTLEIEQEVSEVAATTSSSINSPTIQQRRIKTQVVVASGETVVLAGFMQDRAEKGVNQVPLLGNIPVVGNLFKDKADQIRRTELLIAITPQIIKDGSQLRGIAAEFRDRINFTTRPQRQAPPDRRENFDRVLVR